MIGSDTQLSLTPLNINLNFGGVEFINPSPDFDLCAGTDNEVAATRQGRTALGRRHLDPICLEYPRGQPCTSRIESSCAEVSIVT